MNIWGRSDGKPEAYRYVLRQSVSWESSSRLCRSTSRKAYGFPARTLFFPGGYASGFPEAEAELLNNFEGGLTVSRSLIAYVLRQSRDGRGGTDPPPNIKLIDLLLIL